METEHPESLEFDTEGARPVGQFRTAQEMRDPMPTETDAAWLARWLARAALGLSVATRRALVGDVTLWFAWAGAYGRVEWPIRPGDLVLWLATPAPKRGLSWPKEAGRRAVPAKSVAMATVRRRLWAIRLFYKTLREGGGAVGGSDPTRDDTVRTHMRTLAQWSAGRATMPSGVAEAPPAECRPRPPLTSAEETIIRAYVTRALDASITEMGGDDVAPTEGASAYKRLLRDWALFLVARATMARRSEIADLLWEDVRSGGRALIIRSAQPDAEDADSIVRLSEEAVAALEAWRCASDRTTGPIFVAVVGNNNVGTQRLSGHAIDRAIRELATRAEVPLPEDAMRLFGAHSTRIGMAIDMIRNGASLRQIMTAGRWNSLEPLAGCLKEAGLLDAPVL